MLDYFIWQFLTTVALKNVAFYSSYDFSVFSGNVPEIKVALCSRVFLFKIDFILKNSYVLFHCSNFICTAVPILKVKM